MNKIMQKVEDYIEEGISRLRETQATLDTEKHCHYEWFTIKQNILQSFKEEL